jgi:signal transduction histidine kinase
VSKDQFSQQERLREVIEEISSELELRPLLTNIVQHACELLEANDGSIGLYDEERELFRIEAVFRMPASELGSEMTAGVGLAGEVLRRREPIVLERYGSLPRPTLPELEDHPVIGMPIFWREQLIGFFGIGAEAGRRFGDDDLEILSLFGRHAAIAIENARRLQREQRLAALEERQRLARDLHDSVTQMLYSATLIAQSVSPAYRRDPAEGERRVARLLDLNRSALAEMRALLRELRPPDGQEVAVQSGELPLPALFRVRTTGLVTVLGEHLDQLGSDGLAVSWSHDHYDRQSPDLEEVLFRIAQETLHNTVKHARARGIQVCLHSREGRCHLSIHDDGVGFDARRTLARASSGEDPEGGMGILAMRQRVQYLEGTFRLASGPGQGTRLEVSLPCSPLAASTVGDAAGEAVGETVGEAEGGPQ